MTITPGLFSQDISGYSILARKTFEQSNDLEGVTIYDYTDQMTNVVLTAERGKISFTPDYQKLIMDLENGEIHQVNTKESYLYRRMRYLHHRIVMDVEGFDFERSAPNALGRSDRELSAHDMRVFVDSLEASNARTIERIRAQTTGSLNSFPIPGKHSVSASSSSVHQQAMQQAIIRAREAANVIESQYYLVKMNQDQIDQYSVEIH